jgi:hypothetical protein
MKTKLMLMVFAIIMSMNPSFAQPALLTQSASINPSSIYIEDETEVFTVITWNDATKVVSAELDFMGYIIELEEDIDYVITEIDEFTSLFEFIEEDDFKKQRSTSKFDDPWYITLIFDQGDEAILTLYPIVDVQYSVIFSVADYMGNSIDDAVITFDGYTFDPGEYFLGFYYSGKYDFTIEKQGFVPIEGEIIINESPISEHFVFNITTSIDELKDFRLNIFPNPANDFINLTFSPATNNTVTIFSSDGRLAYREETSQASLVLYVGNFHKGIYVVKVESGKSLKTVKFIKN